MDKNTGLKGGSKMNNCTKCVFLTEVTGGNRLVFYCKIKNEKIFFPTLEGRFCENHRPYLDYEEED